MMVQDVIVGVASMAFCYALVPQVLEGFRRRVGLVTLQTSAISGVGEYVIAGVALSLGLWFSASVWLITGTLWFVLWGQRRVFGSEKPE